MLRSKYVFFLKAIIHNSPMCCTQRSSFKFISCHLIGRDHGWSLWPTWNDVKWNVCGKIFGKPKAYMCGQGEKRVFPPAWMKNSSDIGFVRVPAIAKQPTRSYYGFPHHTNLSLKYAGFFLLWPLLLCGFLRMMTTLPCKWRAYASSTQPLNF